MSKLETDVRDLISRYLAGSFAIEELQDSLPDPWDLEEAGEPDAQRLVMRVVGLLSEVELGRMTEPTVRYSLKPEASWLVKRAYSGQPVSVTPSPAVKVRAGAGSEPLEAYA